MDKLIEVRLSVREVEAIQKSGYERMYPHAQLDPDLPGLGGSVIPEKYLPIFCDEDDDHKYPEIYVLREDREGYEYTMAGIRLMHEAHAARYVPGYWVVSDGDVLHVFSSQDNLWLFLQKRRDFSGYTIRAADGTLRKIQITINLVE